jgi:hypothetical protein
MGKQRNVSRRQKMCCIAPLLVIVFVCGVSPPPPLESRLQAGGVSTNAPGFFLRLIACLAMRAAICG